MRVGILCAGDREVAPFLESLRENTVTEKAMLKFHQGRLGDIEAVVLYSGVCKVNAAVAAQLLIDLFQVDCIINAGTAGGMDPALKIFDTVIATETDYHDVEPHILTGFHPWLEQPGFSCDEQLLKLSRIAAEKLPYRIVWGKMVTGEAFITDDGRAEILKAHAPLTVDMETAAVAHVAYVNRVPFLSVRCITDTADHSGTGYFEENCPKASAIARDVTLAILAELRGCEKSCCT